MALRIRPARPAEARAIASLHLVSWRDAYASVLPEDFLAGPVETAIQDRWASAWVTDASLAFVLVALMGRELAGFVAAQPLGARGHVENLHVRPGLRNAGIGRALLGAAARRLREAGAREVDLSVFAANEGALRFYRRLGGQVGPVQRGETFGQEVAECCVVWPVIEDLIRACRSPLPA